MSDTFTETQRKRRGHNFLPPKAIRAKTPALYATDSVDFADKVIYVKWFCASWTWYAAEVDWDTGICFGYVEGDEPEWGYFDLAEMEAASASVKTGFVGVVTGSYDLVVERDCFFTPTKFSELD